MASATGWKHLLCAYSACASMCLGLSACQDATHQAATQQSSTQAAFPVVEVVQVTPVELPDEVELPGRVEAYRTAEVRARVSGIVAKRNYQEGQVVKAGATLFQINPEQLQVNKLEAEAELARSEAALVNANDKLQRYQALVGDQSVSQRDYRAALAEVQLAKADLAAAQAKYQRARLELSYANVTAPIAGVARRALVTEGALVGKDEATHLTTIEQVDPVYVNFSQSAADVFALRKALRAGLRTDQRGSETITLLLPDGSTYPILGKLSFSDVSVNPTTDAVVMRAVFDNPQHILMPGAYVRLKLQQSSLPNALLIPRDALIRDAFSTRVWVVNVQHILESREVQVGRMYGNQWRIISGLRPGELVVVTNVTLQVAGRKVTPKRVSDDAPHSSAVTTPVK